MENIPEIVAKLRRCSEPPFRPELPTETEETQMVKVMTKCWSETPEARPSFDEINKAIREMNKGKYVEKRNISRSGAGHCNHHI